MGLRSAFVPAICLFLLLQVVDGKKYCKPWLGDAGWPSGERWQALNTSVSGRLKTLTPPAAVCHRDWPQYNNATCREVTTQWTNTSFHALNLESVDYNDNTCLPNSTAPCSSDGYPRYIIDAYNAADVAHGVRFAADSGVRLVVKATGHDYPGRYAGSLFHSTCQADM